MQMQIYDIKGKKIGLNGLFLCNDTQENASEYQCYAKPSLFLYYFTLRQPLTQNGE